MPKSVKEPNASYRVHSPCPSQGQACLYDWIVSSCDWRAGFDWAPNGMSTTGKILHEPKVFISFIWQSHFRSTVATALWYTCRDTPLLINEEPCEDCFVRVIHGEQLIKFVGVLLKIDINDMSLTLYVCIFGTSRLSVLGIVHFHGKFFANMYIGTWPWIKGQGVLLTESRAQFYQCRRSMLSKQNAFSLRAFQRMLCPANVLNDCSTPGVVHEV